MVERTILITGGTGSFGSTVVADWLTRTDVAEVRVLSRDEAKQEDLRRRFRDARLRCYLGDVRDPASVDDAMRGTDVVFHAAALKQVPSCEFFPDQAVATNVTGSTNVIRSAARHGVRSVVCLSSDKAVYPVNAMGMSKGLMEKVAQAFARNNPTSATTVSCVRYGNVISSRGSVIPLFRKQLWEGGDMTVTDPTMTRFLMTLGESVELVRHALDHAQPGDLFVRKAPAGTIADIATAVALEAGVNPRTLVIGPRHGEKTHEVLLRGEERSRAVDEGAFFRVPLDARSLDYEVYSERGDSSLAATEDYSSDTALRLSAEQIAALLGSVTAQDEPPTRTAR